MAVLREVPSGRARCQNVGQHVREVPAKYFCGGAIVGNLVKGHIWGCRVFFMKTRTVWALIREWPLSQRCHRGVRGGEMFAPVSPRCLQNIFGVAPFCETFVTSHSENSLFWDLVK